MTANPFDLPVEPWVVREPHLDLDRLARTESLFTLSNGHIGLRANLDEGDPHGASGTYLNSFFENRPLPYAEAGYGFPDEGQTIVNVTDGKVIRLLVDDEPFDVRYGVLREHERILDMREGVLRRSCVWQSPAGRVIRLKTTRLVSFSQRSIVAIEYELEVLDEPTRVIVQSELVANEPEPPRGGDPRVAAALAEPLVGEFDAVWQRADRDDTLPAVSVLVHRTRTSKLLMAAAMTHDVEGPPSTEVEHGSQPDVAWTAVTAVLKPGETLRIVKYLSYGWSSQRTVQALRDQVVGALVGARHAGWDLLRHEQRTYLDTFWDGADIYVEGDDEVQQAVRFGLFHVLQAGARAEQRAIAAKGLTGPGYDGHTFWDTENFVLPVLTYTHPAAAADALRWRLSTIDIAKQHAITLGLDGAAFPWRTIRGQECSGYWPAGTAAFHINADIADAALRYVHATQDVDFDATVALPLLVETARVWDSLGHIDDHFTFHLPGVTGPDEYSAVADDNVYTNLMAQRNLRGAADVCERHPQHAAALSVDEEQIDHWRSIADATYLPYDEEKRVHPQAERFTNHAEWNFEATDASQYPLLLHFPYFDLYRKQVLKQADLVLAMHWRGDAFTPEQKARNFDYYERRTVRDSSLSACTQSVIAAEVGHLELAHDYLGEAALMDLRDLEHNTRDGLHIASLAGSWLAVVAGLGGMRDHDGHLSFAPALPSKLKRLSFAIRWHGHRLSVDFDHKQVTYSLRDNGDALVAIELDHEGEPVTVTSEKPVVRPIARRTALMPRPPQPFGRTPIQRGRHAAGRPAPRD